MLKHYWGVNVECQNFKAMFIGFFLVLISTNALAQRSPQICITATTQVEKYATGNRGLAESRFNANEISQAQYEQLIGEVEDIEDNISLEKCMASTDDEFIVYQCLADNKGNYPLCR